MEPCPVAPQDGIVLEAVSKGFPAREGGRVPALEEVSLAVPTGSVRCLVGPTGCGKTTVLRLVAGLESPDSGRIAVRCGGPGRRAVGYLTQEHTLLPWLTTEENVALPLRVQGFAAASARERARDLLATLGLEGHGARYPYELSGGMRQRAAIGRLLAAEARCWLLDEPFASLDERTRHRLQELLVALVERRGITVLFVTHALDEALYLADDVTVLSAGPGRVIGTVPVPDPRPRDRLSENFGRRLESIRRMVEEAIR